MCVPREDSARLRRTPLVVLLQFVSPRMLGLSFFLAVIVALLPATVVEAQGGCTVVTSELLSTTIKYTFVDFHLAVEIREGKIPCNSYDYGELTVFCLYSR